MPIYNAAPPWRPSRSQVFTVYHGCTTLDLQRIASSNLAPYTGALRVASGRVTTDFGRGFYTTSIERQAKQWAWYRYYDPKLSRATACQPCVLRFTLDRHALAQLSSIAFALGHYDDEDFWSLVQHCRQSVDADPANSVAEVMHDHHGPVRHKNGNWYDVAYGPVAAFWTQRSAMVNTDQLSFHTQAGEDMLNAIINANDPTTFGWSPVI